MKSFIRKPLSIILSIIIAALSAPLYVPAYADNDEPSYILGDINSDSIVTLKDASVVQRIDVGLEFIADSQYVIADVDGDGSCTLGDAYLIQKYALGQIMEYPVTKSGFRIGDSVPLVPDTQTYTETLSDIPDTQTDTETLSDIPDTQTDTETLSDIPDTQTDTETLSDIPDTQTDTETLSDIPDTQTDTDSEEPPIVIPLSDIKYMLNGGFEREDVFPDNWVPSEDRGSMYAEPNTGINGSNSLKLYNQYDTVTRVTNQLSGFEPLGEYKLTGKIKGKNIQAGDHEDGAFLDVGSILGGNYYLNILEDGVTKNFGRGYMIDPNNNWLNGTFDWAGSPATLSRTAEVRQILCADFTVKELRILTISRSKK